MLFHVTHTHTSEVCPGGSPERLLDFNEFLARLKAAPGIKVMSGHVSPIQHVFYFLIESDDFNAVTSALGPLNSLGSGEVTPVLTLDVVSTMAETGTFRMT